MKQLHFATSSSWKYKQAQAYFKKFDIELLQANIELPESRSEDVAGTVFTSMFASCPSLKVGALAGTAATISYLNCQLSATELNNIYTNLGTVVGQTITVTGNYGNTGDNPAIATAKGWTVTG